MRQITRQAADAFINGRNFSRQNMMVSHLDGVSSMYLHGNLIAEQHASKEWNVDNLGRGMLRMTLAGWNTPTTRERLNGLLIAIGDTHGGARFYQKNFGAYYGEHEISSDEWIVIT